MCQEFACLPEPGGLQQQDAELMNTMAALRGYSRVHKDRPKDGPGAQLLADVKAERIAMKRAGELG
jgi:hypothetical protein